MNICEKHFSIIHHTIFYNPLISDIDECRESIPTLKHTCDVLKSECINTAGSYHCKCRPGFRELHGVCTGKVGED